MPDPNPPITLTEEERQLIFGDNTPRQTAGEALEDRVTTAANLLIANGSAHSASEAYLTAMRGMGLLPDPLTPTKAEQTIEMLDRLVPIVFANTPGATFASATLDVLRGMDLLPAASAGTGTASPYEYRTVGDDVVAINKATGQEVARYRPTGADTYSFVNPATGMLSSINTVTGETRVIGTTPVAVPQESPAMQRFQEFIKDARAEGTRFRENEQARFFSADQARLAREAATAAQDRAQTFTTSERQAGQVYATGEREAGQTFTAGESALDRGQARELGVLGANVTQRGQDITRELGLGDLGLGYSRLGQEASQFGQRLALDVGAQQEQAREADITAAGNRFRDISQITPQLGQLALNEAEFTRNVLSNPSDTLARLYLQRGEAPPRPQVTQADILNQARLGLEGVNQFASTAGGFEGGRYQPPTIPEAAPVPTAPPAAPLGRLGLGPQTAASPAQDQPFEPVHTDTNMLQNALASRTAGLMNQGPPPGFTLNPVSQQWERPDSVPPQTASVVTNQRQPAPQGHDVVNLGTPAPRTTGGVPALNIAGQPVPQSVRDFWARRNQPRVQPLAEGGLADQPVALVGENGPEYLVKTAKGHLVLPVDPSKARGLKRFQGGGILLPEPTRSLSQPRIQTPPPVQQSTLQALALQGTGPGPRSVLGGQMPTGLRFSDPLPTPQMLGALTPDERANLGMALAYRPIPATLADVETSVRQRFGPTRRSAQGMFGSSALAL